MQLSFKYILTKYKNLCICNQQLPMAVQPWTGVFNATAQGPVCFGGSTPILPDWDGYSEDCLRINIYTPHVSHT